MARIANQCVADASLSLGFTSSERFIKNNGTFADVLAQEPDTVATLDRQRLGRIPPTGPVMVSIGRFDDIIPQPQAKQLASDYCAQGAVVLYDEDPLFPTTPGINSAINHGILTFSDAPSSLQYLTDRLTDIPAPNTCGSF